MTGAEGPDVVTGWFDQHCHLPDAGASEVVAAALAAGVVGMIDVGCDVAGSAAAIERASGLPGVWATAGVHPHDAAGGLDGLERLLAEPVVVAVGECGLDYHYMHSPAELQRQVFAAQIALAHRHDLALVIHTREAWDDTLDILGSEGVPERTVFHCFTGGPAEARRAMAIGAYLSFSGIVSFGSADDVREAAAIVPADAVLVETDAPFLAPVPHRGRRNESAYLPVVGAALAAARDESVAAVADATSRNATRVFALDSFV